MYIPVAVTFWVGFLGLILIRKKDKPRAIRANLKGWYVDSGASVHGCNDKTEFKTYEAVDRDLEVCMANNSRSKVYGKGSVELNFTSGKTLTLTDVFYVPEIRQNLVSVRILDENGFKVCFEDRKVILSKGGEFFGEGYSCDKIYKFSLN